MGTGTGVELKLMGMRRNGKAESYPRTPVVCKCRRRAGVIAVRCVTESLGIVDVVHSVTVAIKS